MPNIDGCGKTSLSAYEVDVEVVALIASALDVEPVRSAAASLAAFWWWLWCWWCVEGFFRIRFLFLLSLCAELEPDADGTENDRLPLFVLLDELSFEPGGR
jgi:hypothetical protein